MPGHLHMVLQQIRILEIDFFRMCSYKLPDCLFHFRLTASARHVATPYVHRDAQSLRSLFLSVSATCTGGEYVMDID